MSVARGRDDGGCGLVGVRVIMRHVLWTMLAAHIVAMIRVHGGVTDNLLSTTHLH